MPQQPHTLLPKADKSAPQFADWKVCTTNLRHVVRCPQLRKGV